MILFRIYLASGLGNRSVFLSNEIFDRSTLFEFAVSERLLNLCWNFVRAKATEKRFLDNLNVLQSAYYKPCG